MRKSWKAYTSSAMGTWKISSEHFSKVIEERIRRYSHQSFSDNHYGSYNFVFDDSRLWSEWTFKNNGKFAISFAEMKEGFGAEAKFHTLNKDNTWNMKPLNLKKLDLSMDSCLPRPLFTDNLIYLYFSESSYLPCFYRLFSMFMRYDYELIFVTYFTKNAQERAIMLHEVIF